MSAEADVLGLLLRYQYIWFSHFPTLSRRAEWHIVQHLCTTRRDGSPVGELYGLAKQLFLLDDATVKERLLALSQSGLCALDPPGQIYARSVAQPTAELLEKFDAHLRDFALAVQQAAKRMGIEPPWPGAALTPRQQAQLPRLLTIYGEHWNTALDATFEAARLSPARRIDARRNLFSSSHWNLIHRAMLWHFQAANGRAPNGPALNGQALNGQALSGQPAGHADKDGILADQLAAQLLQLTGQTLQTTRDHIAWLLEIGLFERKPGRSLHVVISRRAAEEIGRALSATAARLPAMLQALNRQPAEFDDRGPLTDGETAERTLNVRPGNPAATLPVSYVPEPVHSLEVSGPDGVARRVPLRPPLTIGRTAPSDLVLSGVEVSRSHCRILEDGGRIAVEDMRSTNGTFLNETRVTSVVPLNPGDRLRIGSHVLVYRRQAGAGAAVAEQTMQARRPVGSRGS
jgi:hypothetical protein